jgi:hypothetical protein
MGSWTLEAPPPTPSLLPRISRLLADTRTVLGGHSIQDMLDALGKLIPVLRAVGGGGRDLGL